jgi:branched-chain amino acid transport system ATP-binding protein
MSIAGAPLLEAAGLVKRYGGLVAIDHVDITLSPGSITGVIGPNGAGKSTLIGLIGGALTPSQGSIRLEGRDVSRMSASDRARAGIGRTYQIPRPFLDMSVEENLEVAQYSVAPSFGARLRAGNATPCSNGPACPTLRICLRGRFRCYAGSGSRWRARWR